MKDLLLKEAERIKQYGSYLATAAFCKDRHRLFRINDILFNRYGIYNYSRNKEFNLKHSKTK